MTSYSHVCDTSSSSDFPRQVQSQASKLPEMRPHPGCIVTSLLRQLAIWTVGVQPVLETDLLGVMKDWILDLSSANDWF